MGTHGKYPPPRNPNPDPQRSMYMGDLDPRVTLPMSIPMGILASTQGRPGLMPSLKLVTTIMLLCTIVLGHIESDGVGFLR